MKQLAFLFLVITSIASAQTVGQYELRKRGASGFTSYGVTLSNGQVIGQTAGAPAAITPFDGAFSSLSGKPTTLNGYGITDGQPLATILTTFSALSNSSGVLTNNGSGSLSYTATSTGGLSTDGGKLVKFDTNGALTGTELLTVYSLNQQRSARLYPTALYLSNDDGNSKFVILQSQFNGSATITLNLPTTTGNLIGTGDTGTVTNAMLAGSIDLTTKVTGALPVANGGTGSTTASAARVALLPSLSGNNGKVLAVNAGQTDVEWITAGGGLTIGTTTITSGTTGRVLYNNAGIVGEMTTSGSGTQLALTNSPTFTTPTLGAATATTINGLTITSSTGTLTVNNGVTLTAATTGTVAILGANNFTATQTVNSLSQIKSTGELQLQNSGAFAGGALLYATSSNFTICRADSANYSEVLRASLNGGSIMLGLWDGARFGNRIGFGAGVIGVGGAHTTDLWLEREAAAIAQLGSDANGSPTNQTLKAHDGITGTDQNGANLTLASGNSTGTGTSAIIFSTPAAGSTGTTARTASERVRISSAGITIGSGSAISKVLTATASLDFGSIAAQSSADLTVTVTGAATGDAVIMGLPASPSAGVVFNAFVSSANTVTIRATNATSGAIDPASATYRATVIQH